MDLHPDRKLRGRARHERATLAALTRLGSWFPDRAAWAQPFVNVKLPTCDKAISEQHGRPEFCAAVMRQLVGPVADNQPRDAQALPARNDYDGGWIKAFAPASCLMTERGVDIPAGFAAHGTGLREYDSESDLFFEREEWVVMEIAGSERAISKGMCHDQV
jgi:hypothetical protein